MRTRHLPRPVLIATALVAFLLAPTLLAGGLAASPADELSTRAGAAPPLATPPANFEANLGQFDPAVRFLARTTGADVFFTADEIVTVLPGAPIGSRADAIAPPRAAPHSPPAREAGSVVRMRFEGSDPAAAPRGLDEQAKRTNYFLGSDASQWRAGVPSFARVVYEGLYPGIDLVFHGAPGGGVEYDLVLAPGADAHEIRLAFDGASSVSLDADGSLLLRAGDATIRHGAPALYQSRDGAQERVDGRFAVLAADVVGFETGAYDASRELVIDPPILVPGYLVSSTYYGGASSDSAQAMAVDGAGNVYLAGWTYSANFPTVAPAQAAIGVCPAAPPCDDAFVTKINPAGVVVYSTYLGGTWWDGANGIAVDSVGNALVAGDTSSSNFPVTAGSPVWVGRPDEAFTTKLSPAGVIVWSKILGGSNVNAATAVAVDTADDVYITGYTVAFDFPLLSAYQTIKCGATCGFVAKYSKTGTLLRSSYFGVASTASYGTSIVVDAAKNAYVAGITDWGYGWFKKNPVFAAPVSYGWDGYLSEFNATGLGLVFSTPIPGNGDDYAYSVRLGPGGTMFVAGTTNSTDFPAVNAWQSRRGGAWDAFVVKIAPGATPTVAYSTYYGGIVTDPTGRNVRPTDGETYGYAIATDVAGNAFVTGKTNDPYFPPINAAQPAPPSPNTPGVNGMDAIVVKLDPTGSPLFSSVLGGTAQDAGLGVAERAGLIYVGGATDSTDFPTQAPTQAANAGARDAFASILDPCAVLRPVGRC